MSSFDRAQSMYDRQEPDYVDDDSEEGGEVEECDYCHLEKCQCDAIYDRAMDDRYV